MPRCVWVKAIRYIGVTKNWKTSMPKETNMVVEDGKLEICLQYNMGLKKIKVILGANTSFKSRDITPLLNGLIKYPLKLNEILSISFSGLWIWCI